MEAGPPRWRFTRSFSLDYARMHARRGDAAGAIGQAAKAVLEEAHAVLCERGRWACNERGMVASTGLHEAQALFERAPRHAAGLSGWLDLLAAALGVPPDEVQPWKDAGRS